MKAAGSGSTMKSFTLNLLLSLNRGPISVLWGTRVTVRVYFTKTGSYRILVNNDTAAKIMWNTNRKPGSTGAEVVWLTCFQCDRQKVCSLLLLSSISCVAPSYLNFFCGCPSNGHENSLDLGNISLSFLAPRFKKSLLPKFQKTAQPKGWISFQKSKAFYSQVKIFTGHLISTRFKLQLCKEPSKGGALTLTLWYVPETPEDWSQEQTHRRNFASR